jgi:hypothetical protein
MGSGSVDLFSLSITQKSWNTSKNIYKCLKLYLGKARPAKILSTITPELSHNSHLTEPIFDYFSYVAIEVFAEHGLRSTTVHESCSRANINIACGIVRQCLCMGLKFEHNKDFLVLTKNIKNVTWYEPDFLNHPFRTNDKQLHPLFYF